MSGALPFAFTGVLKTRPNTVIESSVPCSVWPTGTRVTLSGLSYDHAGEAPLEFYESMRGDNRVLVLDGEEYVVVGAQKNIYLPHTALVLRRVESAGA